MDHRRPYRAVKGQTKKQAKNAGFCQYLGVTVEYQDAHLQLAGDWPSWN